MKALYIVLPFVLIALLAIPFLLSSMKKNERSVKKALRINLSVFASFVFIFLAFSGVRAIAATVQPEEPKQVAATEEVPAQTADAASSGSSSKGLTYIGAALAVGLSGIGAGLAVAAAAPAAIGAVSENEKSFGKAMIFVVLGEGIAIYGLVIAFMIVLAQ